MSADPDDALVNELAAVLGPDLEPPEAVLHAARESLAWRTVDAELALLTYDSVLDDAMTGARSSAVPRMLTFEVGSFVAEVEIELTGGSRRVIGQLLPPAEAAVELLCDGTAMEVEGVDPMGRFSAEIPSACRLLGIRFRLHDGTVVVTAHTPL